MKQKLLILLLCFTGFISFAQQQNVTFDVTPESFDATDEITVTVSNINMSLWNSTDLYLWMWYYDLSDDNAQDSPTNGGWDNSDETQQFTDNGDGTYSYTFTPSVLFGTTNIGSIGMLAKAEDGSGDRKTQDHIVEVGVFQLSLDSPTDNPTVVTAGNQVSIAATTNLSADFELFADGTSVDTQTGIQNYTYNYTITEDVNFELVATEPTSGTMLSQTFNVITDPVPTEAAVPAGMEDGINFDPANPNSVTLVLYAPGKNYVHAIGNFNNWVVSNDFLLNKDSAQDKFWITIDNLDQVGDNVLFQYLVDLEIRIADPYSTLILSPYNDQYIPDSNFENLPEYPSTMTNEAVSWIRRNVTEYQWQIDNFVAPNQEDLVIYELLIRDFDDDQTFDAVIERLDYLENLGINAIELMPVSEFDGNLSWGYNPSFHMALDKYYGSPEKFKELVDEAHSRGIAVILDVVYNHATGQNPLFRMYNDCNGCTGGLPAADSPYFNTTATHSYSVFLDFNHQSTATQEYVEHTLSYWIEEFKVDGFRWDLTKGFTQNCTGDEGCTNSYQADRVQILKDYADVQWALDPDFYVIFEHLGNGSSRQEEIEWANYRIDEGKGIMFWNKMTNPYNEATMGYNSNSNLSDISYQNIGTDEPRNIGYMESHDEERLMYKNLAFGASSGGYDVTDLPTALDRMETAGAFFFTIPGPKMLWQFQELGYDTSIFACEDGTVPTPYGDDSCKLAEKPDGWDLLNNPDRVALHNAWRKMIALKQSEEIFSDANITMDVNNSNGLKKIHLHNPNATGDEIEYVTVLGNFGITTQSITPNFQQSGTWYNLMDSNSPYEVSNPNATISLAPGEYFIYGSAMATLSTPQLVENSISIYPNPAQSYFSINEKVDELKLYDVTGKLLISIKDVAENNPYDISGLPSGLYFVHLRNGAKTYTSKIIIN